MLRDSAEEERPPRAEQQACVDVRGLRDDALVEQAVDLVCDRFEHALDDLRTCPGILIDDYDLVVAGRVVRERRREREPVRERLVHRLEHVVRDARADHREQDRRRHRHSERHHRLVDVLGGGAVLDRIHDHSRHPGEHAVDDEPGRVGDEHRPFAQLRPDVERGRERLVVCLLRTHDLEQRHQRDGVEEVQADDTRRCTQVRRHVRDGDRRCVRREDAHVGDGALELGEDVLLHVELFEHCLEDETGELLVLRPARDE